MISQADEENLDDSLDFNYGSQKVDANAYNEFLENEKSNFRLLINKVLYLKEYLLLHPRMYLGDRAWWCAHPHQSRRHVQHDPR